MSASGRKQTFGCLRAVIAKASCSVVLLDLRRRRGGGPLADNEQHGVLCLAPSKCTCLPKWVTNVPAGIGKVASGSN